MKKRIPGSRVSPKAVVAEGGVNAGSPPRRRAGRPLSFDRDAALEQAMLTFWRHGYESTSLRDLTDAMGVTAPSIYSAFGDKQALFLAAVDRYNSGAVNSHTIIDGAASAREAASELLRRSAIAFTGKDTPAGCLLASAAVSGSVAAGDVQAALARIRRAIELRLRRRISEDIKAGVTPAGTQADALAAHVMAVIQGMSTLARDGAPRAKLISIAEVAMLAWP